LSDIPENDVKEIASRVLRYLKKNPDQSDTLRGICEWWLFNERIDYAIDVVSRALDLLASEDMIEEIDHIGSEKRYRLKKEKKTGDS